MGLKMLRGHHLTVMEAKTVDELRARVIRFTRSLEFETVNAMVVIDHSANHTDFHCVDNTPQAYRDFWSDRTIALRDPVMQHCKRSSVPLVWDRGTYVSHGQGELWEEGARFGFKTGVSIAMHLPGDRHFCIGIDRDKPLSARRDVMTRVIAELQLFAIHAYDAAIRLMAPVAATDPARPSLTPRELEALRWTMEGELAWGVGKALNISEQSAEFHLQSATTKLGCGSKFEAVLKAIRLGLLA